MRAHATSIDELLLTADRLLTGQHLPATSAGRYRGASLALRTALEIAVDRRLTSAMPGLGRLSGRARLLCLRCYTDAETARRTKAVWSHLCLGCHYHQYEIGPSRDQVRAWQTEVGELVEELLADLVQR
ncbi:hypothetical protein J3S85_14725 [Streptomyces lavenduligriseus]|nr:hypothetical protein J3S85_14725 [Streptomyces lavenduligriseus]